MEEIGSRFCQQKINQNRMFGLKFVLVFSRDTFTINIDLVSDETLREREREREGGLKTRI